MGRPRVPLSASERSLSLQGCAAVVVLLGVTVAALALSVGRTAQAALVVGIATMFAVLVWSIRVRLVWLTAALLAVGIVTAGYLEGHPFVGAAVAVLVVGWTARQTYVKFDPETIKPFAGDVTDPQSAAQISAFESLGFERVGALSFEPSPGRVIVETIMIGPRRDRYACTTDIVITVQSTFGQRVLTSRNSGVTTLPPEVLANDLRGADAGELCDAHESALAILRARGLTPDHLEPAPLLEFHTALERRAIEWGNSRARRQAVEIFIRSGLGAGALDEGSSSQRRIEAWLDVVAPTP